MQRHTFGRALFSAMAAAVVALALAASPAHKAAAQANPRASNVIPESEAVTIQAKITAIKTDTRAVTLQGASGTSVTVTAGPLVRLEMLKVGDRVNAKYYRSVAFVVNPPRGGNGVPTSDDSISQMIARPAQAPGGAGARLTKISGTVVAINRAAHSVDLVDPSGGGIYTIDVTNPARIAMLGTLKVGDTITAVVSETLAVSIDPAPKSWF